MDQQYLEISEIPKRAMDFWNDHRTYKLPLNAPYLGMGSSYFAPLAFKYMGKQIQPEMASEFFNYFNPKDVIPNGVILSQSGLSTEALWCTKMFDKYTAISNYKDSPLCNADNVDSIVDLKAGIEQYSSSNSYINTLLALFKGLGYDAKTTIDVMVNNFSEYEHTGKEMAEKIFSLLKSGKINGIYIIGSGPNIATAFQAALIMSESTKINFNGLAMAQYDHGPKETAINSIVIQILAQGPSYQRGLNLSEKIKAAGAHVFCVEEPAVKEHFSILNNIIPFNFMAYYLAQYLNIKETFTVGGKVTQVQD
ncbi:hypothetical protein EZ428_19100 [Pedobacter frigiditerrae]|uniref:Glutamine--fructose-6-phosphate aminotransferase [isomerizing] n=1 Tax=Pedobacter frigiditerrae TaxID=2530452 RepID=A0A4R0MQ04_9SPHI|nr:hypothetical protein [Pedobacter frigiditerrae]TCC88743.1 hypothetical protein EZ428_19100 [Pedobacter frigiditerrae]